MKRLLVVIVMLLFNFANCQTLSFNNLFYLRSENLAKVESILTKFNFDLVGLKSENGYDTYSFETNKNNLLGYEFITLRISKDNPNALSYSFSGSNKNYKLQKDLHDEGFALESTTDNGNTISKTYRLNDYVVFVDIKNNLDPDLIMYAYFVDIIPFNKN